MTPKKVNGSTDRAMVKRKVVILVFAALLGAGIYFALSSSAYADCAGVETNIINCGDDASGGIYHLLSIVINILTMGVGVLAVLGITHAGIQYMASEGNEQKIILAKKRIYNVVLGLLAYGILWAGTQWLIPGGIFNNPTNPGEESSVDEGESSGSGESGGESTGGGAGASGETTEPAADEVEEFDRPASEIL